MLEKDELQQVSKLLGDYKWGRCEKLWKATLVAGGISEVVFLYCFICSMWFDGEGVCKLYDAIGDDGIFYSHVGIGILMFGLFTTLMSCLAIRRLHEFPFYSLKDITEEDRDLVLNVANCYNLAIDIETNISEAYRIVHAQLNKSVVDERSGLLSMHLRDYQSSKKPNNEIESLYNQL